MRSLLSLTAAAPLLLGASAPVAEPVGRALEAALAEARSADAEQRRLESAARAARTEAGRLRSEQAAAAQAILGAEARISAAEAAHRQSLALLAAARARLERKQRPAASLLAGLAMMGRRPPLLALADGAGGDEMVRVRILLDSTLPVIRARAAALSADLERLERLERRLAATRGQLARRRAALEQQKRRFAALESRARQRAEQQGASAIGVGDVALAAGEEAQRLSGEAESARLAAGIARELASLGPAPLRPAATPVERVPLLYRLPADAPLIHGFGAVSASGVRSRGITLATRRGSPVVAPAAGLVRFSGPFRDYDGIVIIDHGGGWTSLIVNVRTSLEAGHRVGPAAPLGRALGPIEVELAKGGRRLSPALIAGSSQSLSNGAKGG